MLRDPEAPGGRYEVVEPVEQGGMGTVYRAQDRVLGREVALEILRADLVDADAPPDAWNGRRAFRFLAARGL